MGFIVLYIQQVRASGTDSVLQQRGIGLSIERLRECLSCDLRQHAPAQILYLAGPRNDSGKDSIIFRVNAFHEMCLGRRDRGSLCFRSPETDKNVWRSQLLLGILGFVLLGLQDSRAAQRKDTEDAVLTDRRQETGILSSVDVHCLHRSGDCLDPCVSLDLLSIYCLHFSIILIKYQQHLRNGTQSKLKEFLLLLKTPIFISFQPCLLHCGGDGR